jgi:hypothetical protein
MDAGPNYAVMLRVTDGSPAVRLGEGFPNDLSPDNRWVLARVPSKPPRLMLYPTGVGEVRRLDHGEFSNLLQAAFAADGEHVFLCGAEGVKPNRCYVQSLTDGARRPISREGTSRILPSPDGVTMLVRNALGDGTIERIDGTGTPRQLSDSIMANVVRWSPDGRALWVRGDSGLAVKIDRVDVASGQRTPLVVVEARNKFGLLTYTGISLADDPRVMAYQVWRYLSELYVVSGMK